MEKAYELPFFAPESRLTTPLSSPHIIETKGDVIQEHTGRRIVRFSNYIINHGSNVSLTEGQNMLFVRELQLVPVPEVFALYSSKSPEAKTSLYFCGKSETRYHLGSIGYLRKEENFESATALL